MDNNLFLFFSDRTEILRDKFLFQFNQCWQNQSAFAPPTLIVPNKLTSKWLSMEWAKHHGIAMMLDGQFLDAFLWKTLTANNTSTTDKPVQLTRDILELWIVDILSERDDENLQSIYNYIGDSPDRIVQIAQKLARLLLEYELARPKITYAQEEAAANGLIETWLANAAYFNQTKFNASNNNTLEQWQRALYLRLFGPEGYQSKLDKQYLSLPQLVRQLEQTGELAERLQSTQGQPIFLWSAGLSAFHRDILSHLANYCPVFVYQLNPCSEFWEDVDTRSGAGLANLKLPDNSLSISETDWANQCLFEGQTEMPLLKVWGHIGKENIKLWCQAADYDFDGEYSVDTPEMQPDSLLHGVQYAVLNRQSELEQKLLPDASVRMVEVPNRRREVEVLHAHILRLMEQDESLRLSDIGVLMPDPSKYRADFEDVFGGIARESNAYIPWVFADESAGTSHYAKGVIALIQLLKETRFDRRAVFNLLRNPLVQNAFGYDGDTLLVWESWCDDMGTYFGFDFSHRQQLNTTATSSDNIAQWHTFRSALDRLLLGRLVIDNGVDTLPYRDWYTDDGNHVELFVEVIETLFDDLSQLWTLARNSENNWALFGKQWASLTAKWLNTQALPDEAEIANSLNDAISHIVSGNVFSTESAHSENEETTFSPDVFYALVSSHLDTELPSRSNILTGRLTITALREGRPIPWKHVFVLGMSAGEFPASESNDPLDLRAFAPLPGDYTATRQARYLFLELLMCTRESLTVSWQNYDLANDRPILPSSILIELEDFIRTGVLAPLDPQNPLDLVLQQHTWMNQEQVDALATLTEKTQKALSEQCYWPHLIHAVHADEDYGTRGGQNGELDALKILLIHAAQMAMGKVLLMSAETEKLVSQQQNEIGAPTLEDNDPLPSTLPFAELKDFLVNPIEMVLKRQLGLYDSDQRETTQVTDEPIDWTNLDQGNFRHEWLHTALESLCNNTSVSDEGIDNALENAFTTLWQRKIREGKTPKGVAAEQLRERLKESWDIGSTARNALHQTLSKKRIIKTPTHSVKFVPTEVQPKGETIPKEITITDIPASYLLDSDVGTHLLVRGGSARLEHIATFELLNAINSATALTTGERNDQKSIASQLAILDKDSESNDGPVPPYTLTQWEKADASQWLAALISDMYNAQYQKHNIPLNAFELKDWKITPDSFTSDYLRGVMSKSQAGYYPSDLLQMFDDHLAHIPDGFDSPVFKRRYQPLMAKAEGTEEGRA